MTSSTSKSSRRLTQATLSPQLALPVLSTQPQGITSVSLAKIQLLQDLLQSRMPIRPKNRDRIYKEIQRVSPAEVPLPVELLLRLLHHAQQVLAGHRILEDLRRLDIRQDVGVWQQRIIS